MDIIMIFLIAFGFLIMSDIGFLSSNVLDFTYDNIYLKIISNIVFGFIIMFLIISGIKAFKNSYDNNNLIQVQGEIQTIRVHKLIDAYEDINTGEILFYVTNYYTNTNLTK